MHISSATIEQVVNIIDVSDIVQSVDLGVCIIHIVNHPDHGEMAVVSSSGSTSAIIN